MQSGNRPNREAHIAAPTHLAIVILKAEIVRVTAVIAALPPLVHGLFAGQLADALATICLGSVRVVHAPAERLGAARSLGDGLCTLADADTVAALIAALVPVIHALLAAGVAALPPLDRLPT